MKLNCLRPDLKGFRKRPIDIRGWNYNAPVFRSLIEQIRPELIIEVGTWKGASAIHMANICDELELSTTILCIDTWLGSDEMLFASDERSLQLQYGYPTTYYQFLSNILHTGHEQRIIPFPQTSTIAARWLTQQGVTADLIYIDGSHVYADVKEDLHNYWPLLRPGGVLFGDDYDTFIDVAKAVKVLPHRVENNRHWVAQK